MGSRDIKRYNTPAVSSVPGGQADVLSTGGYIVPSGFNLDFIVTTIPSSQSLSIWNFLFSLVIDSLQTDSDGYYQYLFPDNINSFHASTSLLSSAQGKLTLQQWTDWSTSNDTNNVRNNIIRVTNNDSASHTYYLFFKGYTIATNPSVIS